MKETMKTIISIVLSGFLAASLYAQEQSSAKPSLPIANAPAIPLTAAVVVRYEQDGIIELQETGKKAERVKLAVHPVFIDRDGRLLNPALASIKPGTKVLVHLMPDRSLQIVDRIII